MFKKFGLIWVLLLFLVACGASEPPPTAVAVQPTFTATATNTPTAVPPTPTDTATAVPTATPSPSPTATNVPATAANLVLALDYDRGTLAPLSPRDYFPVGVGYVTAVFDYQVAGSTAVSWQIRDQAQYVVAEGSSRLNANKTTAAIAARLSEGLDPGEYEFLLQLGEVSLAQPFEVFWNPTLWPISVGTEWMMTDTRPTQKYFPAGTNAVFAAYATANFSVGDEILAEWFINGKKLGEHFYVWDNAEWSLGVHQNKIDNQVDAGQPLPSGLYEIRLFANQKPKQCQTFIVLKEGETQTATAVADCESFTEELVASGNDESTWDRYQPRSWAELEALTDQTLAESEMSEMSIYIEAGEMYQYPSRIEARYLGQKQATPAEDLFAIQAWLQLYLPGVTAEEVADLFGSQILVEIEGADYWLPIQTVVLADLLAMMDQGGELTLYTVWIGAIMEEAGPRKLYVINTFE